MTKRLILIGLFCAAMQSGLASDKRIDELIRSMPQSPKIQVDLVSGIGTVGSVVGICQFGLAIMSRTKEYFWPGHDRQLEKATQVMHKCLFEFQTGPKDEFNMPVSCRKQLESFEMLAGREAFYRVRDLYRK